MSKSLFCHSQVATSAAVIVFGSTSTRTIDAASVCNTSASAATISLWLVPSAGSAADGNALIEALSVNAGETVILSTLINHAIPANSTIHAQASAGTSLTLIMSGRSA